jgi:hypothetical protein
MMAGQKKLRVLPVGMVVRRGFLFAWESRSVLGAPYALYAAITIAADLLMGLSGLPDQSAAGYVLIVADEIFALSFAVGIHRYVLLAERRGPLGFFHRDRKFAMFALQSIKLFIAGLLVAALVDAMLGGASGGSGGAGVAALLVLATVPLAALALARLALVLPATALGERIAPQSIWERTAGNGLRLLASSMLALSPFLLFEGVLARLYNSPGADPALSHFGIEEALITIVVGLASSAQLIVFTVVLALQYDALIRGNGPADAMRPA